MPCAVCRGLILAMGTTVFFAEEVTAKPTALNSPPPLLHLVLPGDLKPHSASE